MKVIFSHGKKSGTWGSKITKLANVAKELGFDVVGLDYSGIANLDNLIDSDNRLSSSVLILIELFYIYLKELIKRN